MKIAIATDDKLTISRHFGRAENYIVISLDQEKIIDRKTLSKVGNCHSPQHRGNHSHKSDPRGSGFGHRSQGRHDEMFANIKDCDILLTRGMGRGAYLGLRQLGIQAIVTDIPDIDDAVQAILNETIVNHTEKLH